MSDAVAAVGRFVSAMIDSPDPVAVRFTPQTLYERYQVFHEMSASDGSAPLPFEAFDQALNTILGPALRMQEALPL